MSSHPSNAETVLDHVAFGVADVRAIPALLEGQLGGRPLASGAGREFVWWQWEFARGGVIEVLEPAGPSGGFVERFLASRGPGIHHVTFKVPDLATTAAHARSQGFEIVGYDDSQPSWKECFFHPKQALGIVVQLAESHPELQPGEMKEVAFPAAPRPVPAPADVLGVRLSARSVERARHQWEAVLGGRCSATREGLCFHWPDSPLRVAVAIDARAPEGPRALELAKPAPGLRLDAPDPILGTPLALAAPDEITST